MSRFARLPVGVVLGLALVLCFGLQARTNLDEKENAEAQAAVLKMADKLGCTDLARSIARENAIEHVMHQFKPRTKGGIGIGCNAPPGVKDGIELTMIDLANDKRGFTRDAVDKLGNDLVKVAQQTQAIAEINDYYIPRFKREDRDPAVLKQMNNDMKAGAADLAKAAQARDVAAVKAAANKINNSCVGCHAYLHH